ncbi:tRNA-queuosine alpha-mannosyltransferase domain-containing protein [Pseudobacteriovorax antillogorgiicola]|uniref:tRNA-queuosine alpha-mannosyltransferase n=1 Tax=Pseudobacteriovorax antillogorgiicola TaxID=1513793 RepID=A0A1Y6CF47_9BACT|nr:DUF3524 domain-containing protein [Pseudobacteriovorax antillogorgiicola]TCS51672.1 uncharacterized protein DUF3524 [Pseudobacteriovorax antillogorgiicola]SMF48982.1 protein of unknown function [Pseudobacteriovorax antillogorgiicola]
MNTPKILVLSAYHATSHDYWYQQIEKIPWDWTLSSLPPRYYAWRARGNPLSFLNKDIDISRYDLILATSMVDLASMKGIFGELSNKPCLLYFHENQFAYPSQNQKGLLDIQITSIYSALAADGLAFNSSYNRDTFLQGVTNLLGSMPDFCPKDIPYQLKKKSWVIPVPLASPCPDNSIAKDPLHVVWNHRWEHDKGPERLYEFIKLALDAQPDLRFSIIGQQFRQIPPAFNKIRHEFANSICNWGFIEDRREYEAILDSASYILSTAHHDFQGLAVLEACLRGCLPILPRALAYPEFFSPQFTYPVTSDRVQSASNAVATLQNLQQMVPAAPGLNDILAATLLPRYKTWLQSFIPS